MTELADIFAELGISHYLHEFLEQGFDTWETILDITESDFDALGVKLGHRRKLQRKIANTRGLSSDRALASPRNTPGEDRTEETKLAGTKTDKKEVQGNSGNAGPHGAKRKYRRHPKPDENAPERPPSAYVIFSNKMREELKGRNLSFTEIAKLVGENWQNLSPGEKEPYEQSAFTAKERYNNELAEYKKTDRYKEYSQYLIDFKSKHSNSQQGVPAETATEVEVVKRPKLEAHPSTASSGTGSSASQHGDAPMTRGRVGSTASNSGQWHATDNTVPSQVSIMPKLNVALGGMNAQTSPRNTSPPVLPGYRDSIFKGPPQGPPHPYPWRDSQRDEPPQQHTRPGSFGDSRMAEAAGFHQHARRTEHGNPPPLLTSESTNRSTGSSNSTVSSTYFSPRTPLEPPLERALPVPSMYSNKGNYENQLPPLRPPSLSPQSTVASTQYSPSSVHPRGDYPGAMPPMRGYGTSQVAQADPDHRYRDLMSSNNPEENLDPVSALIRAGEIVNRNSRNRLGS